MRWLWQRAFLIAPVFLNLATANWNDTSTGIDLDKLKRFPIHKVRSGLLKEGSRITFDGLTATSKETPREVLLQGLGKSGKRWEAHLSFLDQVWRADLDGNGTQDYILFSPGPYFNGRVTPPFSISILLMDSDGLPVPFFTVQYQEENNGISHLVDLSHDGHAELLINTYDENTSRQGAGTFCSGHWTTQAYRFKDFAAEELKGTLGGIRFPFVHDWAYGPDKCLDVPGTPLRPAAIHEHGTKTNPEILATLIGTIRDNDAIFKITPVSGCKAVRPAILVYEHGPIREIAFPTLFTTYAADLEHRIQRNATPVQLRGIDGPASDGTCSVNLLWAKYP